jgi:hypothetical protein
MKSDREIGHIVRAVLSKPNLQDMDAMLAAIRGYAKTPADAKALEALRSLEGGEGGLLSDQLTAFNALRIRYAMIDALAKEVEG